MKSKTTFMLIFTIFALIGLFSTITEAQNCGIAFCDVCQSAKTCKTCATKYTLT